MKISNLIFFTLIAVFITDALKYISLAGLFSMEYATYISSGLNYLSLLILITVSLKSKWERNTPQIIRFFLLLWICWNLFSIIRGFFLAQDYWDWKFLFLSSFTFSMISLTFFYGEELTYTKYIFRSLIKYIFPLGFLLIPLSFFTNQELYSRLMAPVSLLLIFIPFLKFKNGILLIIVASISVFLVISFRSNVIKISFSFVLLGIFYLRRFININWFRFIHICLFVCPLILFFLAVFGEYNILNEASKEEGYSTMNKEGKEENLMTDTRTFIYEEALNSLLNSGNWILGESASGSFISDHFDDSGGAIGNKRYSSEVGILNILVKNGIVGVIIYFCLLFTCSFIAINYSKNILSKLLGLFIAFRWMFSFLEEFTQFDLNFFFFWLCIGLVSTKQFRNMTNYELKYYISK